MKNDGRIATFGARFLESHDKRDKNGVLWSRVKLACVLDNNNVTKLPEEVRYAYEHMKRHRSSGEVHVEGGESKPFILEMFAAPGLLVALRDDACILRDMTLTFDPEVGQIRFGFVITAPFGRGEWIGELNGYDVLVTLLPKQEDLPETKAAAAGGAGG